MDFIDDFIEEYKCNPCLWRADSHDFRNRTKRQEAYIKLIAVATKHGELYNVERTKQKINNLRCAFRHQLRKYNEVKKKGEKYEPYCPKRRYFESLMFLKDEEIPEKKLKREDNIALQQNANINVTQPEACEEFSDAESLPKLSKCDNKLSPTNSADFCPNLFEETEADPILGIQTVNSNNQTSLSIQPADDSILSGRRKSFNNTTTNDKINSTVHIEELNRDTRFTVHHKNIKNRKRSTSLSSQISNDEIPSGKYRADITNMDLLRLCSLALKNSDNQLDDYFTNFGKIIAHKLRSMENAQAIYAEKIIADVLYQGQMKMLSAISITQFLGVDNTTVYVESPSK